MGSSPDRKTLDAYDRDAAGFAAEWHAQPAPTDLQALARRYFRAGPTADIGCGSGRDTAWLHANGFPATGFDASDGLLAEARRRYPNISFRRGVLPELAGVDEGSYANVLCETVLMHLPSEAIPRSVERLVAILKPGGTLYLSWRVTEGGDIRDKHGRLYASFDPDVVRHALTGAEALLDEQVQSASSGKSIRRIVARKRERA
ncbi:MAG TPA: class I SAM-dependent methyltransferase [Alphaproteobacteria bacterium]|nr:class I SAM-dependent methyltransferase [Alphaproteobacteria bacterium]